MRRINIVLTFACLLTIVGPAAAAVRMPAVFDDNMVLQRGRPAPVWGWAAPGEEVVVSIAGQTHIARADEDGKWKVALQELELARPTNMTVKGSSGTTLVFNNVAVGEVWLCSGQSNMVWGLAAAENGKQTVADAEQPNLRLFFVPETKTVVPAANVDGRWLPCTPSNIVKTGRGSFSAVAYYFGRQLQRELGVPVGLIQSAWGGTPAEFWTSRDTLARDPALKPLLHNPDSALLYNGMIAPLIPYAIRGAVWYQGESNVSRAHQYRKLFPAMIANWRNDWGQGDFPFGFVQLAPFRYGGQNPENCAELREAQLMTLKNVPNTGMAVTMDIGNVKDIHPRNKLDVGKRLALWALSTVYGRDAVYSGPIYKSMAVEGNKIRLRFEHVDGGLAASDGKPLRDFTIAGSDRKFIPATAEIDGDSIVVHSDGVSQPLAVRYAWRDDAVPNLANKAGLPASPFRTDQWKGVTEGK
ncbi:MAG: sialate O-acetylesterase [Pirellulales bacterium]|nr:sialate O-acetylesterase [Pirellulales bacterium]